VGDAGAGTRIAMQMRGATDARCGVVFHVTHLKLCLPAYSFPPPRARVERSSEQESIAERGKEGVSLHLVEHKGIDRGFAEAFIADRFQQSFGARIEAFMPRLFGMRDHDGRLCGAFGLRSTSCRLFVEQYLHEPVETAIAASCGEVVERRGIVEVGHLSATYPGAVRTMIGLLATHLYKEGFEWVVFAGTASLRNAFARMGLFPIALQRARIERLPTEERAAWGHYYDHSPEVLVGRIREGVRALAAHADGRGERA
jgi:hypothetical protein